MDEMRLTRIASRLGHAAAAGWQTLRHNLPTSTLIVLALAAGIALATAMFGILDGYLYRGLPVEDPERIAFLYRPPHRRDWVSPHDYLAYQAGQNTFEELAAYRLTSVNLSDDVTYPERYYGCAISHEAFSVAHLEAAVGRVFNRGDDVPGAAPVALIGHHVWRQRFGSDPDIVGRQVLVNGETTEIVGVLQPGIRFPVRQEVYLPLRLDVRGLTHGDGTRLNVFGRLRDGVGYGAAQANLNALARRLAAENPWTSDGPGILVKPYTYVFLGPRYMRIFLMMQVGALLVLAAACTKAANLILLQAARQRRDLGIRRALGAGTLDMVGRTLAESLLLALLGAAGGIGLAHFCIGFYTRLMPLESLPYWVYFALDREAAAFTVAITLGAALAAGLYPAWRAWRDSADIAATLHDGDRGSTGRHVARFHAFLVVADVAVASLLLVLSLLFVRALIRVNDFDLGIEPRKMLTAGIALPAAGYPGETQRLALVERLTDALGSRPEVAAAVAMTSLPGTRGRRTFYAVEGQEYATLDEHPQALRCAVTPNFFTAFNIRLRRGRLFTAGDRMDQEKVAVVNRSFADRVWPGLDPIGRRLRFGRNDPAEPWRTVVGVVPDAWMNFLGHDSQAGVYTPFSQTPETSFYVAVLLRQEGLSAALLREELHQLDPRLPIFYAWSMDQWLEFDRADARLFASIYVTFGLAALGLASVGLFGSIATSVSRRTQEIGLRMALGARRRDVLRLILREGMTEFLAGLVLGLAAAAVVGPLLGATMYTVSPHDPVAFLGTAVLFTAIAVLACVIPAWRASRLAPAAALHDE
jgi:putative ABC transport system permease protein